MKDKALSLAELIDEAQAERLTAEFRQFGEGAKADEDQQQRILSSVMRKAGIDMKETFSVKRTKKKRISIAAAAIAAACLCGFTAYAVYQYNYGNAFKNRENAEGEVITGDVQELESTTQPFDGVIMENTFTDVDITVEGVVCETGVDHLLLTASKKDGTPFAESDEVVFRSGFGMCIPIQYNAYFKDKEGIDVSELYWGDDPVMCELNDDGTLSIMIDNTWKCDEGEYDIILGFKDIYSYDPGTRTEEENEEYVNAECELLNNSDKLGLNYHSDGKAAEVSDIEENKKLVEALTECYSHYSDERYEGEYIVKCHIVPNERRITPEENDHGMDIQLSGLDISIRGDGDKFLELAGLERGNNIGEVNVTIRLENGEEITEKAEYQLTDNTEYLEDDPELYPLEVFLGKTLSRFTDPYTVNEILINGNILWKK